MDATRQSLLLRARSGDEAAWADLAELYRPLLVGWLRYQGVRADELDDLVQETLVAVLQALPAFTHSGRQGAFRTWLRRIARNHACDYWKGRRRALPAAPDEVLSQLEDEDSELNRIWEREHDHYVLRCLLELMELEFEPSTIRAFRRVVLEGASNEQVTRELGLSLGAVYAAKSRVLRRLSEVAEGLLDQRD